MGHQTAFYSVLWVANNKMLRTPDLKQRNRESRGGMKYIFCRRCREEKEFERKIGLKTLLFSLLVICLEKNCSFWKMEYELWKHAKTYELNLTLIKIQN